MGGWYFLFCIVIITSYRKKINLLENQEIMNQAAMFI